MTQGTPPKGGRVGLRFNCATCQHFVFESEWGVSNGRRFS